MSGPNARDISRPGLLFLLGAVGLFVLGFTLVRRSIILSDEGYLLLESLEMVRGKVLYRDLDSFVAPGVWFLLSTLFRLVEPSVFASRMAALVCYLATAGLTWRIVRSVTDRRFAAGAMLAFAVMTVWAFPAWTWSFYSPWAVLCSLAALERLLAWREGWRRRDLVAAGVALGLALTFKQNYGVLALLGSLLAIQALSLESQAHSPGLRGEWARALPFLTGGMALMGLPVLLYFVAHGAVGDAVDALILHPFGGFLGQHDIGYLPPREFFRRDLMSGPGRLTYGAYALNNTPARFGAFSLAQRGIEQLHVVLYWLPPVIFAAAAARCIAPQRRGRPLDGGLAAVLVVGAFVFLGVFPRADFNHLMNVYQMVVVVGAVLAHRIMARRLVASRGLARLVGWSVGLLLGAYATVAVVWYVDLLASMDSELNLKRGGVLLSREQQQMLEFEVNAIRSATRPGEAVLTLPGLAMLNFLADRPMPTRYTNLYAVHIAHDQGRGVVEGSEARRVNLVVAEAYDFFSEKVALRDYAPVLTDYLRRYFEPFFSVAIDAHHFLRRRRQPLPPRSTRSALEDCDTGPFQWWWRGIQEHLLYRALYHPLQLGKNDRRPQTETLCRVQVPEGAQLAFALGYRQPSRVKPGTRVTGEIWIEPLSQPDAGLELLHREQVEPRPVTGWFSPPPAERRLELDRWGGEEVLILFRTLYQGDAAMNPLDPKGFSMIWQDPMIEFTTGAR